MHGNHNDKFPGTKIPFSYKKMTGILQQSTEKKEQYDDSTNIME